jgi:IS1 family transposase/transposase-like protein
MSNYINKSCPNQACNLFNFCGAGNIAHRSWTGKDKKIERLRCKECKKEFSERRGSLMEHSHLEEDQVKTMLKCQRWGVPDEGIADIAEVDIKTVYLFQEKAGKRAILHHHQCVRGIEDDSVQIDEGHTKLHGGKACWVTPAIALSSLLIVFVTFGSRTQAMANTIVREVLMRLKSLRLVLTDGWLPYAVALLKCVGEYVIPRRTGKCGRPKQPFWKVPEGVLYGQVVKKRNERGWVVEVVCRAVFGSALACVEFIRGNAMGQTFHTIHIERWFGSLRVGVAACRRKTRCGSKVRQRHEYKVWKFVDLYNWVLPHSSLGGKNRKMTPAMAAGLIDHVMSYQEYIWLPVHIDQREMEQWQVRASELDKRANRQASKFNFKQSYDQLEREKVACY